MATVLFLILSITLSVRAERCVIFPNYSGYIEYSDRENIYEVSTSKETRVNMTMSDRLLCNEHPSREMCGQNEISKHDSSLLTIKGHRLHIIYNRVPKSASTTLRFLFRDQAEKRKFTIISKEVFVPFLLPPNTQQEVVNEFNSSQSPTLYERHMYFLNFESFQKPQPIYINVIRDPIQQVISSYYYSRQTCIYEKRCYFDTNLINETLDECVLKRPARQCVDAAQGVSPTLPFFCGNDVACETNITFALQESKKNILNHYTVVGIVEELYSFLFVLEHLLPRYFTNVCLNYLSTGTHRKENTRVTYGNDREPSETTKQALRRALVNEYALYEFVKRRFHAQFQQVLQNLVNAK